MPSVRSFDPEALGSLIFPNALSVIIVFGLLAFFGYRLFRYFLVIGGAVGCGLLGYTVISPWLISILDLSSPSRILLSALLGIVLALAGGLVVNRFMRPAVYLFMAGVGFCLFRELAFLIAGWSTLLSFLADATPSAIFATVMGLVFGAIVLPFFKTIYVLLTSVGGLALAGYLIANALLLTPTFAYILAAVGALCGIFAMRYQLRTNLKSRTPGDTDEEADEQAETNGDPAPDQPKKKHQKKKKEKDPRSRNKKERSIASKKERALSDKPSKKARPKKTKSEKAKKSPSRRTKNKQSKKERRIKKAPKNNLHKKDIREKKHFKKQKRADIPTEA